MSQKLVEQPKGKELEYPVRPGKKKKQADFGCFNGLYVLLLDTGSGIIAETAPVSRFQGGKFGPAEAGIKTIL